ncbi:SNF1-interacting protein [Rhizina undulata]
MANRPVSLIPVTLREAAIDSPTFRGTVIHYGEQVELVEKWLEGYLKATQKLCNEVHGVEELVNNFLGRGVPNMIAESMIDHDYTLLAMRRFTEGSKWFWGAIIGAARKTETTLVEPLVAFQKGELRTFKETRRLLDLAQTKYDNLLIRYASQSKSKEPSSLREDAFQLYEARKVYVRACFDFCVAAPKFRANLDRLLTKIFSDQWREQMKIRREGTGLLLRQTVEIERIRSWSEGMEGGEDVFWKELVAARKDLEDKVKRNWQPARELEEYASSTVPYLASRPNIPEVIQNGEKPDCQKQGYLFMRTVSGKPTRTIWVRRWFFIKNGIFGWFIQGYRGGAVEESEKIGVLLCNIKPAFQEERRFCFEVKTKDTAILLQTETQAELTTWLAVFEQAKRTAVEQSSTSATQAFSIIPPSVTAPPLEPAHATKGNDGNIINAAVPQSLKPLLIPRHITGHRASTSADEEALGFDRSLTLPVTARSASVDITRNEALSPAGAREKISQKLEIHRKNASTSNDRNFQPSSTISSPSSASTTSAHPAAALISASHNALPFNPDAKTEITTSSLAPMTLANTPAPMALTKAAAVTSGSDMPLDGESKGHRKTHSLDIDGAVNGREEKSSNGQEDYPLEYPPELKVQNLHFRGLFPVCRKSELVLLVFRATWSQNTTNELPGRCYVTADNIYFYAHHLGLVCTTIIPLTKVAEVKASPGKDCDFIFMHLSEPDELSPVEGDNDSHITLKVYLEPIRLLQRRLMFLVSNANATSEDHPPKLPLRQLLVRLIALEKEVDEKTGTDTTESWEDVSGMPDELGGKKRLEGAKTPLDSETLGQRGIDGKVKEATRFKLPSAPVLFEPKGMDKKAFERDFDVSPKALFHVMFGDKSGVFQSFYRKRRAQYIKQGPWVAQPDGKMKRNFTYHIEHYDFLRRLQKADVVDHQTIEKHDDHLCYVITDKKIPWHLPHRENFMLVINVVITYVAKSKCKLAIWTAVEWSWEPTFSKKMIHRQALDDLDLDALDLGNLVADQTQKLGSHSHTKNAIAIFGGVGQESDLPSTASPDPGLILASDLDPGTPRLPIKQRTLDQMVLETLLSMTESAISNIIIFITAALRKGWEIASAQRILLVVLAVLVVWNMMLGSRSTVAYWSERRANKFMEKVGVAPNGIMSRAVYLRDLEDVMVNGTELVRDAESKCYAKFRELASFTNLDASADLATRGFSSAATRATARRLRASRQSLGAYRHELLVALKVVNSAEREMLNAEWDNWLFEETGRCRHAESLLLGNGEEMEEDGRREVATRWLRDYCGSCEEERRTIEGRGLRWT